MSFRDAFEEPSGGSGPHNILSATHTDTDTTKAPVGGDVFKFVGGVWVPGRVAWGEVQSKPATFPPDPHGHTNATTTADGFMAGADKGKLNALGGNIGSFMAYQSVLQVDIPNATDTPINFQTETWDVSNAFANSAFTAPVNGKYWFSGGTFITPAVADKLVRLGIQVGGVTQGYLFYAHTSHATGLGVYGSTQLNLQAGDVVRLVIWHNFGVNTSDLFDNSAVTYFTGHLLRS